MLKVREFILQNALILLNCLEALVPFGQNQLTSWVRIEYKTALTAYVMYWASVKEFSKIMVAYLCQVAK